MCALCCGLAHFTDSTCQETTPKALPDTIKVCCERSNWAPTFPKDTVSGGGKEGRAPGQAEAPRGPHKPGPSLRGRRGARAGTRGAPAPEHFSYLAVREAERPRVKPGTTGRCAESKTLRRPRSTKWLPRADPRKPLPQSSAPGAGPGGREERGGVEGRVAGPGGRGQKGDNRAGPRAEALRRGSAMGSLFGEWEGKEIKIL